MSSYVEEYCRELAAISINYARLEWTLDKKFKDGRKIEKGNLFGLMGELHTLLAIETLQCRHHEDISIYNLAKRKESGGYMFTPTKRRPNINFEKVVPPKRRAGKKVEGDMGELDMIVMMQGTPVIIETHLGNYDKNKGGKKCSLQHKLREAQVNMKVKPTRALCNTPNVRLVYVVRREFTKNKDIPESNMYKFISNGGIIVPFARKNEEWLTFIDDLRSKKVA
jgi:hypothetical protein